MKKEEYVKTVVLGDMMINIGLNDEGQCYFFEFLDGGEIREVSCGAYNFNYMDVIKDYFGFNEDDYEERQELKYLLDKQDACGLDRDELIRLEVLLRKCGY